MIAQKSVDIRIAMIPPPPVGPGTAHGLVSHLHFAFCSTLSYPLQIILGLSPNNLFALISFFFTYSSSFHIKGLGKEVFSEEGLKNFSEGDFLHSKGLVASTEPVMVQRS